MVHGRALRTNLKDDVTAVELSGCGGSALQQLSVQGWGLGASQRIMEARMRLDKHTGTFSRFDLVRVHVAVASGILGCGPDLHVTNTSRVGAA